MVKVQTKDGFIELIGGLYSNAVARLTPGEARALVEEIYNAIPVEFENGEPVCPKCGMVGDNEGDEDEPMWNCNQIECDGYHQTYYEGEES